MLGGMFKIFRLIFGLVIIAGVILVAGSYKLREEVIEKVQYRSLAASSLLLSRPIPLQRGVDISEQRIIKRLKRLDYRGEAGIPNVPGSYFLSTNELLVYLKETQLPTGELQPAFLARIALDGSKVESIRDARLNKHIETIWLEGEILSAIGSSSSRASSPRRLGEFPRDLIDAVIAIEDERFYSHIGLDFFAIARALLINLKEHRVVQGGSTITQQLAKNLFFSSERNLARKILEAGAAILMETAYSKEEILELYLNEIFLAQEGNVAIHGFPEAARSFFDKELSNLTLAEAATLAGIIKAPSKYSPRRHPQNANLRRRIVINKMSELGLISTKEREKALAERIHVVKATRSQRDAPYFVDYMSRQLETALSDVKDKFSEIRIHSGLDREYQLCAESALAENLGQLEKTYPRLKRRSSPLQAALISVVPHSGETRAWVGGRSYELSQFDRVSQAKRQPGSAFKPFVYLTALDKGLNSYRVARPSTTLLDEPMELDVPGSGRWSPENYDKRYRGEVTVRQALTYSLNVPTVYLATKVGIDSIARTAELVGFGANLPRVPALALGAGEVSPFDLAQSYTTIANGGQLVHLQPIISITASEKDSPLYESLLRTRSVFSEPAAFVLTDILRSVIESGTARSIRSRGFTFPAAGKTGTTNDARDAWFVGFTPALLTVVWVGFDDNRVTGLTGASGAIPIWTDYMKCVAPMETAKDFIAPPGVVYRKIDTATGLLATRWCPDRNIAEEVFVEGTEPITACELHSRILPIYEKPHYPDATSKPPRRKRKTNWWSIFSEQ